MCLCCFGEYSTPDCATKNDDDDVKEQGDENDKNVVNEEDINIT